MRDKEKSKGKNPAFLILLLLIVLGGAYYMLFYTPNSDAIRAAVTEQSDIQNELEQVQYSIQGFEDTLAALESLSEETNSSSRVESYNNIKQELSELNNILSTTTSYSISFSSPTLEELLVRREFQLQFNTASYADAKEIIKQLAYSRFRCLLGDISFSTSEDDGATSISVTATFFETMYDGTPDSGLPDYGEEA